MKSIFACALAALMLSACGARPPQSVSSAAQAVDPMDAAQPQPQQTRQLRELSEDSRCNTGDAFYSILSLGIADVRGLIVKVDFANAEEVCICQNPGCKHDSEACNAFIPNVTNKWLYVVDGALYLCNSPYFTQPMRAQQKETLEKMGAEELKTEVSVFEQAEQESVAQGNQIVRIALDASEKSEPLQLTNDYNMQFLYTDGAALYGRARYYDPSKQEAGNVNSIFTDKRLRVDLTTGECTVWPLSELEQPVGVYNNQLLMARISSNQDLEALQKTNPEAFSAAYEKAQLVFYTVDPNTDERADLCEIANSEFYGMRQFPHSGGSVFYMKLRKGTATVPPEALYLAELNLASGAVTKLEEFEDSGYRSDLVVITPSNEEIQQCYLIYNTYDQKNTIQWWYDVQTKQKYQHVYTEKDFAENAMFLMPVAQGNDGTWLFLERVREDGRALYTTMQREKYLAGDTDFRTVKMYEPA